MKKASIIPLAATLIAIIALSTFLSAAADTSVSVYIMDPYNPANGGKGLQSSGYWVGQIPLRITGGSSTVQTLGYCMAFDRSISVGSSYSATLAPVGDSGEWRAVSYALTWNNPTSNSEAAALQVAVWRLLNQTRGTNYYRPSWLDVAVDNAGNALSAQAWGRDVVRVGDVFRWVSPIQGNLTVTQANAGQTVAFTVQLSDSGGSARPNVQVLFNATLERHGQSILLNSTHVSPAAAYTNSLGQAQVSILVPSDIAPGEVVSVEASTKSIWPQRYIDVNYPSIQDLIGLGDAFELTLSTNVCVFGFITVLPESPIGALAAVGAVGGGSAVWVKIKQRRKPVKP